MPARILNPGKYGVSHKAEVFAVTLSLCILLACITTAWLLASRFQASNDHRQSQLYFNVLIHQQSLANCKEIEQLKAVQRSAALENYMRLDRNAKLLGIKVTPALRRQARHDLGETLLRFKREPCPRRVHVK